MRSLTSSVFVNNNYGDIFFFASNSAFIDAGQDGVDLDVTSVYSENNEDEGVKVSEVGDGNNVVRLRRMTADSGLEFEKEDGGILDIAVNAPFIGDDMKLLADDGNPATVEGYYKERGATVIDDHDFEGDTVEL